MPRACVGGGAISEAGGWSEDFWPVGLSLSQRGHVFANSVRYTYIYITIKHQTRDTLEWS